MFSKALSTTCLTATIITRKSDEDVTLPDNAVDRVVDIVKDTYNTPKVARKATAMIEQRYYNDFFLKLFLDSFIDSTSTTYQNVSLLDVGCGSGSTMAKIIQYIYSKKDN